METRTLLSVTVGSTKAGGGGSTALTSPPTSLGTFATLNNAPPDGAVTSLLETNGSVLSVGADHGEVSNNWYTLTPDSTGSYQNGTWKQDASMALQRLYFTSNILPNGNLFVQGGEYSGSSGAGNDVNSGQIYNPNTNTWSDIQTFPQNNFGDDPSEVMTNGTILAGFLGGPQTYIYNPTSNTWTQTGTKLYNDQSDEEAWVKLPDNSILTYDIFSSINTGTPSAQRYIPSTGTWVAAGNPPAQLSSNAVGAELGPGFLLPDGRVFYLGANGNTAFYTESSNSWTAGPVIPDGNGADDAPGAELPNGDILFAADTPLFNGPTHLFEFNPTTLVYTDLTNDADAASPSFFNANEPSYPYRMLDLPSGQVMILNGGTPLLFTPSTSPVASAVPTVTSITQTSPGLFTLTGTGLNGIDEGAAYGDDASMASNYPIVTLTDSSGKVFYGTTSGWTSLVATGSTPVTTNLTLPANLPVNSYSLRVIANGVPSAPYTLSAPTIATAAAASPSPDPGTTANLSVLGADALGEPSLTYTWSTTTEPNGAPAPTFSINGTNAAKNDVVTFGQAGNYTFTVTITNALGLKTTSTASVTVTQSATTVTLSPSTVTLAQSATQLFVATALDQFGQALSSQPTFTYSVSTGGAGGTINSSGLYTAPATTFGVDTVHAIYGSSAASAIVTVTQPPIITLQPTNQSVTTGQSATFRSTATGYPTPTVQWMVSTDGITYTPISGATSTTLTFVTQLSMSGYHYEAVFSNSIGTQASTPALLTVSPTQTTISAVSTAWGTAGTFALVTASDGLRLLPGGRKTDLPWLGINQITITLAAARALAAGDVTATGKIVANYGPVTISPTSGLNSTYTITFAQPINKADRVTVTIGNSGIASYTRRLDVLPGDVNDDGTVTSADAVAALYFVGTENLIADVNGDGIITTSKTIRTILLLNGTTLPV